MFSQTDLAMGREKKRSMSLRNPSGLTNTPALMA